MEGNRGGNRNNRGNRGQLPTRQGKCLSENSDWVVLDKDVKKGRRENKGKEQVLPNYICHWDNHNFLNDYFDEHFKELGNPTTMTTTKHFVFVGTTLSYVLKFRYYNLERQRKFSPKVEKFFWSESDKPLGSVLKISVLISKHYNASSSFPVIVSYESRDCIMWRNNFFNKPHLRFSFDKYKPRFTTAHFLLDECVVFDTEGEKIQFWDFKTKRSIIWKNFLDPTNPNAFLGCQLEVFKYSLDLAFLGLVHDNKIQIYTYTKGDEHNPHGTTELIHQKPADSRYSRHRVIKIAIGKLHERPYIGILEENNFYFYEYYPKHQNEFAERRVCLRNRIILCKPYDRVKFQNAEFLLWNSEHLCVFHPVQDYLDISEFPRDYPGHLERLSDSSLLFFGNKNGEFLSFELFDRNFRYVRKRTKHKIEKDQLDEDLLKFIERDAVCIVSEDDSLKDDQVSGTKFGNEFFLGESLRQNVLLATNDAQDVIYVCTLSPIHIVHTNYDYTYLKYPSFPCIYAFNMRDHRWRPVLDLSQSQTVGVRPIETHFPSYFSGMYYRKKDHCLLLVSAKLVYEIDIISRSIKGVLMTKKNLVFKRKLEFPNIQFDCSCALRTAKSKGSSINQIFILGEERSLSVQKTSEPIIIADSLCLYSIDMDKRNISLLENMNRNEVISKCANKKLFSFLTKNNTIKIYVTVDEYPYLFEKKGRTWEAVPIPFVEPPLREGEEDEDIEEKQEQEEQEEEDEGENEIFGSSTGDLYIDAQSSTTNNNGSERRGSKKKSIRKRGLRVSKFFISTVCRTPASILFLVDANTPRYRKFFNPYIFEYSVSHQRWKRPLSIESVSLTQVLSASRGAIYLYKNGRRKIMLYNESVFHSVKNFERDFISVQFM